MGLDMYAFTTDRPLTAAVDFRLPGDAVKIHYWRKHPNLHGWMEQLYRAKGGRSAEFNTDCLALTPADLDRLEQDVTNGRLPPTTGFFFGVSDGTELDDDLAFIAEARAALARGLSLIYLSWW